MAQIMKANEFKRLVKERQKHTHATLLVKGGRIFSQ